MDSTISLVERIIAPHEFTVGRNDNIAALVTISRASKGIRSCQLSTDHMIGACGLTYFVLGRWRHGNALRVQECQQLVNKNQRYRRGSERAI